MRRRLVLVHVSVTGTVVAALTVAIFLILSTGAYEEFAIGRINHTVGLAAQVAPMLLHRDGNSAVLAAMRAYQQENQGSVVLVNARGSVVGSAPAARTGVTPGWRADLARALAGDRPDQGAPPDHAADLRADPLVVAEPVQWGTAVLGAVVTSSPTTTLRTATLRRLVVLTVLLLAVLALIVSLAIPMLRWFSLPVRRLEAAATAIAAGRLDVRAPVRDSPPATRRLARAINKMAEQLLSLLQAQRNFVADASHQIRNPLAALRLQVENLEPFVGPEGQADLDKAVIATQRFAGLVNALLALARAEAREVPAVRIDASAVASERVDIWRLTARQLGVRMTVEGQSAAASCAPDVLDQVLDVLLDNAVHIAPAGTTVRVRTVVDGSTVAVHVADQGPGMTDAAKERACQRFWRGAEQDGRTGSGLGLAIANTLMASVGGSLTFRDVAPRGLDVAVVLQPWPVGDENVRAGP
jgi:signal transduction histidine kinase